MKSHSSLTWVFFLSIILITSNLSCAKQEKPTSEMRIDQILETIQQWMVLPIKFQDTQLNVEPPLVAAGVLCFAAASISSAGGIGGGGLFIPLLTIVAGLDLKTASSFSAFMVTGGSIANVICNLFITKSPGFGGRTLIDYDIALLSEPCMLLGVSLGVICNTMLPEWLITTLFAGFLCWSSFRTCMSGVIVWKLESAEARRNGCERLENGSVRDESFINSAKLPLLGGGEKCRQGIPWTKLVALITIWLSFFVLYLLRGNRYGQGILPMEPCRVGYWIISSLQIPAAIIFSAWILHRRRMEHQTNDQQDIGSQSKGGPSVSLIFPVMALLAGLLGGIFGIGGGMLISPLLLQVGIPPEVTAATCSFMVFFSSTMSAIQYLLLGMEHTEIAFIFSVICFMASLIGMMVVQHAIRKQGRASLIVFSVGTVMVLSTVMMTSYGALQVWRDYTSGKYMGFKLPC